MSMEDTTVSTRWRIDAVRRDVQPGLGDDFHDVVEQVVPTGRDRTFCQDASQAVEFLLRSNAKVAAQFKLQLTAEEQKDVDFILRTRALPHKRSPEKVLKAAAALWTEYATRCAYGFNPRRKIVERRNVAAANLWKRFVVEVKSEESVEVSVVSPRRADFHSASRIGLK